MKTTIKLKLVKRTKITKEDLGYEVSPVDAEDLPLFKHCAEGNKTCTVDFFYYHVRPLLLQHGIESKEILLYNLEMERVPDFR